MIDVLLSALPPQASQLAESARIEPPPVEQSVPQQAVSPPLPKPTVSVPESIPSEASTLRSPAALSLMGTKPATTAVSPRQTDTLQPVQSPVQPPVTPLRQTASTPATRIPQNAVASQLPPSKAAQVKPARAISNLSQKATQTIARPVPKTPVPATTASSGKPEQSSSPEQSLSEQEQSQAVPAATLRTDDVRLRAIEAAKAERLKLLDQKLAEIVAREKPLKEERMRQNLKAIAIRQAEAGQIEQARLTAKDLVLTLEEQTALKTQIDSLAKRQPVAQPSRPELPVQTTRLPQSQPTAQAAPTYPTYPTYGMPGPTLGSNLRLSQLGWPLGNGNLRLAFPLPFPAQLTSGFGWRVHPISGDRRFHRGIDLAAAIGTPVVAAFSGRVEVADWMGGYGMTIILTHPNSTQTLYAHLSEIFVKPGDVIEQGSLIGRVGTTGLSTGPHLHFELHQMTDSGWLAIDPGLQLEMAQTMLVQAMQTAQVPARVAAISPPQSFLPIPPPPTQKFDFLHNY